MALRDGWFVLVKAVVDAVDPVGLLGLGALKDEYDPEVTELVGMARSGQQLTARVVARSVMEVHATRSLRHDPECAAAGEPKP
jgi:hypothetical protein